MAWLPHPPAHFFKWYFSLPELFVGITVIVISIFAAFKIYFKGSKSSFAFCVLVFSFLFGLGYIGFYIAWGYANYTFEYGDTYLIRFANLQGFIIGMKYLNSSLKTSEEKNGLISFIEKPGRMLGITICICLGYTVAMISLCCL